MSDISIPAADFRQQTQGLLEQVRVYLGRNSGQRSRKAAAFGLDGFCYRYPPSLRRWAFQEAGLSEPKHRASHADGRLYARQFARQLAHLNGECIFLLQDAYEVMEHYRALTGRGQGVEINRRTTCRRETDYLALVQLFYEAVARSKDRRDFFKEYYRGFDRLLLSEPHFNKVSQTLALSLQARMRPGPVRLVDIGYQHTFTLFCMASLRKWLSAKREISVHCFAVYPWLQALLHETCFSNRSELVGPIEESGRRRCETVALARAQGTLLGFAIGDALGAPLAGIDRRDLPEHLRLSIHEYAVNRSHPFFSRFKRGAFTANTQLLIFSTGEALQGPFQPDAYARALVRWSRRTARPGPDYRWLGPTTLTAIARLQAGTSASRAGVLNSDSCASAYRVIPYTIINQARASAEAADEAARISAITHRSAASRAGCAFLVLTVRHLLNHATPEIAVRLALTESRRLFPTTPRLWQRCAAALGKPASISEAQARRLWGTSANIHDTLPLALYCVLHHQGSFRRAVLAAANSVRQSSSSERRALRHLSPREQLIHCRGGNTDGIAAIVGALSGAARGIAGIDPDLLDGVEGRTILERLSQRLYAVSRSQR